jgi:hypothetical protein
MTRLVARLLAIVLFGALAACAQGNYATMTIQYQARPQTGEWTVTPTARERILGAFRDIAKAQGYKCNERSKRVEDITCSGPKRMNVLFEPELNRREYKVHFNWVEWHGRTREEFDGHVQQFAAAMTAAVPDAKVRVENGRDPS